MVTKRILSILLLISLTISTSIFATDFETLSTQHINDIVKIEEIVFSEPWSRKDYLYCLNNGYSGWILKSNFEIIGYSLIKLMDDRLHIARFAVDIFQQKKGYGKILLDHTITMAQKNGFKCISLEVRESNTPAVKLYKSKGFIVIGKKRNYYTLRNGTKDHALEMVLLLN
jgi:ribosomal-protein-alanine N-acetyltransferase